MVIVKKEVKLIFIEKKIKVCIVYVNKVGF